MNRLEDAISRFHQNLAKEETIKKINEEYKNGFIVENADTKLPADGIVNYDQMQKTLGALEQEFFKLALCLIYGGHLTVEFNNKVEYKIYIDTVEFYLHCEGKPNANELNVKDPIMYHRNGRIGLCLQNSGEYTNIDVPYLPIMSLYAHTSGYDITFENADKKYRASALIRAYTVTNNNGNVIYRGNNDEKPKNNRNSKPILEDVRSTFLYDILNGFPISLPDQEKRQTVFWEEDSNEYKTELKVAARTNVFESKDPEKYEKNDVFENKENDRCYVKKPNSDNYYYKKDLRLWQFRKPKGVKRIGIQ